MKTDSVLNIFSHSRDIHDIVNGSSKVLKHIINYNISANNKAMLFKLDTSIVS